MGKKKQKIDLKVWKNILSYALHQKKYIIIITIVMIIVAGIDALFPMLNKIAIDEYIMKNNTQGLYKFGIYYFLVVVAQAIAVYLFITCAGKIEMGLSYDIRKSGFNHLQKLSFDYYNKNSLGWLMARMTSDVQRLGEIVSWGLVDMVWGAIMMLMIAVLMLVYNFKLAILAMIVIPIIAVISFYFEKKILKSYRKVRKTNSLITGSFNEGIIGAKTTKVLVREEKNEDEFDKLTQKMNRNSVKAAVLSAMFLPIVITIGSIGTGIVLWRGGYLVSNKILSYGTMVLFISYTTQFFIPLQEIARIFAELQAAQASAERIYSLLETDPDIQDSNAVIKKYGIEKDFFIDENWEKIKGDIEFKNVDFKYKNGEQVLKNFNLKINAGEKVALVGETGSGKSTIVNLICRFFEPTNGKILIDDIDYREKPILWLQSNLGYVLQAPHLFSGSVKDNIAYGKKDASLEEIIKVAKLVNADQFINKMENGYDSDVGEGGNLLSSGEKQLISFARALIIDPSIFVLDEATSSVDTETEKLIQDAVDKVLEGRTSFVIAHRLSTIKNADRILVIDNGEIIEQGNHNSLIKKKGHYFNLYTNQFIDETEEKILSHNE